MLLQLLLLLTLQPLLLQLPLPLGLLGHELLLLLEPFLLPPGQLQLHLPLALEQQLLPLGFHLSLFLATHLLEFQALALLLLALLLLLAGLALGLGLPRNALGLLLGLLGSSLLGPLLAFSFRLLGLPGSLVLVGLLLLADELLLHAHDLGLLARVLNLVGDVLHGKRLQREPRGRHQLELVHLSRQREALLLCEHGQVEVDEALGAGRHSRRGRVAGAVTAARAARATDTSTLFLRVVAHLDVPQIAHPDGLDEHPQRVDGRHEVHLLELEHAV